MRNLMLAIGAMSLMVPVAVVVPAGKAEASVQRHKRAQYREWRGRDGRRYCRKPDGTTGLVVGAIAGGLLGRTVDTRGDRTAGTVIGGVAGALAGREIDRSGNRRCR